jgi:pimeloyl-ACP methyl ester carboxylesterase
VIEVPAAGATIDGVSHHRLDAGGVSLHYVSAGSSGSPVVLVHGWPETWWAFRGLIPRLAETHRVYALDLRGFGDSSTDGEDFSDQASVADLHRLVQHLDVGPVHLLCQDISGGIGFTFAATHADDVLSLIAVESSLAGFGLEDFADVNHGGSWHVGFLGAPGIPELLLPGHERELLSRWAYPMMSTPDHRASETDLDELTRTYSRPHAWRGSAGLYQALFADRGRTRELAEQRPLQAPVLTVDAAGYPTTERTFRQVATGRITSVRLEGVGHLVAQEAPERLAPALLAFLDEVDRS